MKSINIDNINKTKAKVAEFFSLLNYYIFSYERSSKPRVVTHSLTDSLTRSKFVEMAITQSFFKLEARNFAW